MVAYSTLRTILPALLLAGGMPLHGCTGAPKPTGLVLASWNIEHLAAANGAGCRARTEADYAALRDVAERLGADIIALQEVENSAAVARVFDPAIYAILISPRDERARGDCREKPGQRITAQRTGFAIHRERLAASGLRWRELPAFEDVGIEGRRWGTRIRIEPLVTTGDDIDGLELMSLHLKSGCAWGRLDVRDVQREQCLVLRRQRGILEEWLDRLATIDQPFIVIGDFNRQLDQPQDDFWNAINDGEVCTWRRDRLLGRTCLPGSGIANANADLTLANAGIPFPYAYNPKYPYAVDYFVLSGNAAPWLIAGSYRALDYDLDPAPSDHHPIRITLQLPFARPATLPENG